MAFFSAFVFFCDDPLPFPGGYEEQVFRAAGVRTFSTTGQCIELEVSAETVAFADDDIFLFRTSGPLSSGSPTLPPRQRLFFPSHFFISSFHIYPEFAVGGGDVLICGVARSTAGVGPWKILIVDGVWTSNRGAWRRRHSGLAIIERPAAIRRLGQQTTIRLFRSTHAYPPDIPRLLAETQFLF